MHLLPFLQRILFPLIVISLAACSKPYDYRAFRASHPRSVLVLPPINQSTDVKAPYSVLSGLTHPLVEAGYYVIPVAAMEMTFRENGLTLPDDIQNIPREKLFQIFGADAILYTTVKQHNNIYVIISSTSTVSLEAHLIDARTGTLLWEGTGTASEGSLGLDPIGLAVTAIRQIAVSATDTIHPIALNASEMLLNPESPNHQNKQDGILPGPYATIIKPPE